MAAFDTLVGAAFVATARSRSPSFTDRSLRRRSELSLFRFEGVALWVVPGDVPSVLVWARGGAVPGCRVEPFGSSSRSGRPSSPRAQVFPVPAVTAHPVRALVGRFVPTAFRFGLFDGEW